MTKQTEAELLSIILQCSAVLELAARGRLPSHLALQTAKKLDELVTVLLVQNPELVDELLLVQSASPEVL